MEIEIKRKYIVLSAILTIIIVIVLFIGIRFMSKSEDKFQIDPTLEISTVEMNVRNINLMKEFYTNLVGLEIIAENENEVLLGMKDKRILKLVSTPTLAQPSATSAGLYHNAILFEDRGKLAENLNKIFFSSPTSYSGSSDHRVSQAFYFNDPEGNGLELYIDRPKNEWEWENGKIVMGSTYLDEVKFVNESNEALSNNMKMGHIHLKVGNISLAKEFYNEVLGFDIVSESSNSLFVSAGGYHHHIGMNTWQSNGAVKIDALTLGMKSFEVKLSSQNELNRLKKHLENINYPFDYNEGAISISDPWNNRVFIRI